MAISFWTEPSLSSYMHLRPSLLHIYSGGTFGAFLLQRNKEMEEDEDGSVLPASDDSNNVQVGASNNSDTVHLGHHCTKKRRVI